MQLKNLITDDDAVSPVIGVILMVAITVILAAVIGAFVLGIGSNQEAAPQAQIGWSLSSGGSPYSVTVAHDGGEDIDYGSISISASDDGTSPTISANTPFSGSGTFTAGDSATAATSAGSGDSVTLTWTASSGDSSQILGEYTVS